MNGFSIGRRRYVGFRWPRRRPQRRNVRSYALKGVESLESRLALAASPIMLGNLNPGADSGFPGNVGVGSPAFVEAAGTTFFFAQHGSLGRELWKTDGTTEGTVVVKDINAGGGSSDNGGAIVSFNDRAYFPASDGVRTRLWVSDGTPSGTMAVNLAENVFDPTDLTAVGPRLYFTARDEGNNWGLYSVTTAQPAQQVVLASFGANPPSGLEPFNGNLYFQGWSALAGWELWTSNGTPEGTRILHNVNPNAGDSSPRDLTPFGGFLYFVATNNNEGTELYRTTGVVGSLEQLVSRTGITGINANAASSFPSGLTVFNSRLYFAADGGAGEGGGELWRTTGDGVTAERVANLNSGAANSFPSELTVFDGALFFSATNDPAGNRKLFRTSGGLDDVQVVQIGPETNVNPFPTNFAVAGNRLLFDAFGGFDDELWSVTSASATAAVLVKDIHPTAGSFPTAITPIRGGSMAYFRADDGTHGAELWLTDGTTDGTRLVRDTSDDQASGGSSRMVVFGGQVFFVASDNKAGANEELWRTDGTPAGTVLQSDLWVGGQSRPDNFTIVGTRMYMTAQTGAGRFDIFRLDAPGGVPVNVTQNQAFTQRPTQLAAFKDRLVFSADAGGTKRLWVTDGNPANTSVWTNAIVDPMSMREFNGNLYMTAMSGAVRRLYYMNDAATPAVKVENDIGGVQQGPFPVLGGNLYFVGAGIDGTGRELWRHDGNFAIRVSDIHPGGDAFDANFVDWAIFNNQLYFIANGGPGIGLELYRTIADGQATEEVVGGGGVNKTVDPVNPANEDGFSNGLAPCFTTTTDGWLYFTATNGNDGYELWRTDGVTAAMVKNVNTASLSGPTNLTAVGTRVYSASIGQDTGDELWVSDGSSDGTMLVQDIAYGGLPGSPVWSRPRGGGLSDFRAPFAVLQPAGGTTRLIFWADDGVAGREPWMYEIDTIPPTVAVTTSPTSVMSGGTAAIAFTLSEPSTTFVASDVSVIGGTLSQFAGSGANYSALFTATPGFVGTGSITVAAGSFTDTAGNANVTGASATLTITASNANQSLAVESITSSSVGSLKAGDFVTLVASLSKAATVKGKPQLEFRLGTVTRRATYAEGSGTPQLTFRYRVGAKDNAEQVTVGSRLVVSRRNEIAAGTEKLTASLPQVVTGTVLGGLRIDTLAPKVVGKVQVPARGEYVAGDALVFVVKFSENVFLGGAALPSISLGGLRGGPRQMAYVAGSGTSQLTFRYVVQAGDAFSGTKGLTLGKTIQLNGTTITDRDGKNAAALKLPTASLKGIAVAPA